MTIFLQDIDLLPTQNVQGSALHKMRMFDMIYV